MTFAPAANWLALAARLATQQQQQRPPLTTETDPALSALAVAAHHDLAARDELLYALAADIYYTTRRFRGWTIAPWEYADVVQESYLVFVTVLNEWQPRDPAAPAGFLPYFRDTFPHRLATAVRDILGPWHRRSRPLSQLQPTDETDPVDYDSEVEARVLLDTITTQLHLLPRDARVLRRLTLGQPPSGAARSTFYRHCARIVPLVQQYLRETG